LFRNKWKNIISIFENETNIEVKIHNNGKIIKEEDAKRFLINSINPETNTRNQ
jgi:hypothetical protein